MANFLYIHLPIYAQRRTQTNIHVVPTFFYERLQRDQLFQGTNAVGVGATTKSNKRKHGSISHYVRGEPGNLSLILVPINVSNTHWILCVRTNIFYDYKNTNIIIIHLTDN